MKRIVPALICLLVLTSFQNISSQEKLDSLDEFWTTSTLSDSLKLQRIHELIWKEVLFSNPGSAYDLASKQYHYATEVSNLKYQASALNTQGVSLGLRSQYEEAVEHYTRSLKIRKEIGDVRGVANTLGNIGLAQKDQGNFTGAIQNFTESLKIHEELGNIKGQANALNNIGIIYQIQANHERAIAYFEDCRVLREKSEDKHGLALVMSNLGLSHSNLEEYSEAMTYFSQSLKLYEEVNDDEGLARNLSHIAYVHFMEADFVQAMDFEQRSLSISRRIDDKSGIAESLTRIAEIQFEQGLTEQALASATQALQTSQSIGGITQIRNASRVLYAIHKSNGEHGKSLEMYEQYIIARDSISNTVNRQEILRQELTYNFEKQQAIDEIEAQRKINIAEKEREKTNLILIAVSIGTFFVLVFLAILYQRYRVINRQKITIETQYENIQEKSQKILQMEKEKHEQELVLKRKDLETVVANNNMQIKLKENLISALRSAEKSDETKKDLRNIILELNMQIETQNKLGLLEENLQDINSRFFTRLQEEFPSVTKSERELCSYIKLGLSSKEIAAIRNTTVNAVDVTKTRLRKKLSLVSGEKLSAFLLKF